MVNQRVSYFCSVAKAGLMVLVMISLFACAGNVNKDAEHAFKARTAPFSVTIYPTNIVVSSQIESDPELSLDAAHFIEKEMIAKPVLGARNFSYDFQWGANQAAMGKRSSEAFALQVKRDNIQTDYALLVEILCVGNERNIGGVHFYISDRQGRLAFWALTNSHWDEFNAVKPQNRQDGLEVAKLMFLKHLKKGGKEAQTSN